MYDTLPLATVRTQVSVPLRFADGYTTTADVFSFDGLVDGSTWRSVSATGRRPSPAAPVADHRRWCGPTANA